MRYSILYTAPFVAAAYGASSASTDTSVTVVPEISGSVTVMSTYTYSNPATAYLTETNSAGVVTGKPTGKSASAVTTQPAVVTSQPAVATIPNGLTTGLTTIPLNVSGTLSSFTVSVGSSTTVVLSGGSGATAASGSGGAASGGSSGASATAGGNGGSGGSGSSSASASSSSSSGAAAPTNMPAMMGGSLLGLGALFAALL